MGTDTVVIIGQLVIIGLLYYLGQHYLPSFFKQKGKNLATKQDTANITNKVEEVKSQYVFLNEKAKNNATKQDVEEITRMVEGVKKEYVIEIEKLKAALSSETERLKVALSFQSETYKLVAQKRFDAILDLWVTSEALLTDTNFSDRESIRDSMKRIEGSLLNLSRHSILLSPDIFSAIKSYLTDIGTVLTNSEKKFQEGSVNPNKVSDILSASAPIIGTFSSVAGVATSALSMLVPAIVPSVGKVLEEYRLKVAISARRDLEVALRSELGVHVAGGKLAESVESQKQI